MNLLVKILFLLFLSVVRAYNFTCLENYHVFNHACVACPSGSTNAAGDTTSDGNTDCSKKILCLHDHDNPNDFNNQMGPIQNALSDYTFFYPSASEIKWYGPAAENKWYGPTEVPLNYTNLQRTFLPSAPLCVEGVNNVACQCTNCERIEIYMLDSGESCRNGTIFSRSDNDTTIVNVTDYINTNGPFDTVLGFSQGAAAALAYMVDTNPFQKAVLLEGYVPDTLKSHILAGAPFRGIHVLLYFAQQSHFYSPSSTSDFTSPLNLWEISPTVIDVDAVHGVPQNASVINQIKDFLNSEPGDCIQFYANGKCEIMNCLCGYYESNGTCSKCSPGHFCNNIRDIQEPCASGQYQSESGQTNCVNASKGHYAVGPGQATQTVCTAGYFQDNEQATECKSCEGGQYQSESGQTNCVNASKGHYAVGPGQATQTVCTAGYFQDNEQATECKSCEGGQYQSESGQTNCVNASKGHYAVGPGQATQTVCTAGYFQDNEQATECKSCEGGQYQSESGQTNCDTCAVGKYSSQRAHYCILCPKGFFQGNEQATECKRCEGGQYQSLMGNTTCDTCTVGKYSDPAADSCSLCSGGKFQNQVGAAECMSCEWGKYQMEEGNTACDTCSAGYYSYAGAFYCLRCAAGKYQNYNKSNGCKSCVVGQYQDYEFQTACKYARVGHYQDQRGQTKDTPCPRGKFQDQPGQQIGCRSCDAGQYQDKTGQSACVNTSKGYHTPVSGENHQHYCVTGKFQDEVGATECKSCEGGQYQPESGQTTCDNCPDGYYSNSGWSVCTLCSQGKKVNDAQTSCLECAGGQYQNVDGQDECISCPIQKSKYGTIQQYQDKTGQTECLPCLGRVSTDLKTCTPTCAYSLNPHICPTTSIREDIKYIDNYDTKLCSTNGACTNNDCCAKLSQTRLPTAKVKHEDEITNKRNALKLDRVIKNTGNQDIETRWNDVNEQVSTKIISKMHELFMQTAGEIIAQKAAIKKRSRVEQMAEKQKNVVDTFSTLNIAAAKADAKAAEAAARGNVTAEEAARLSIKTVSITVRNVKKALRDQMEEVKQSVSDASNVTLTEDEVSIFIPSADAGIMNDAIDSKMKKIGIEYIRLKLAKNHSNVDFNNMANFDCTGADMNLDEMGLYDFEEVFVEEGETAVACNLGVPVTYIDVADSNADDYYQYEVYCCGYSSGLASGANCPVFSVVNKYIKMWTTMVCNGTNTILTNVLPRKITCIPS